MNRFALWVKGAKQGVMVSALNELMHAAASEMQVNHARVKVTYYVQEGENVLAEQTVEYVFKKKGGVWSYKEILPDAATGEQALKPSHVPPQIFDTEFDGMLQSKFGIGTDQFGAGVTTAGFNNGSVSFGVESNNIGGGTSGKGSVILALNNNMTLLYQEGTMYLRPDFKIVNLNHTLSVSNLSYGVKTVIDRYHGIKFIDSQTKIGYYKR